MTRRRAPRGVEARRAAWTALFASALVAGAAGCRGDDGGGDTDGDTEGDTDGGGFQFAADDPEAYVQIDRIGMPGVAAAVITSKDAYNEADPAADAAGTFVDEITANLTAIHDGLDDDLTGLGLTPCAVDDCVAQAGPLVVPDALTIDLAVPAAFPNGRRLPDQVMDITLAVVLLDLATAGQGVTTFADLPLNPPENDKEFLAEFPYLATPHE
jgi:hypothetical protein